MQIICGKRKRAEVLELRRRSLLKNVRSKYIRDDIEKIPPSIDYMFNPQALSGYLQKIGGIDKLEKQKITPFKSFRALSPQLSTSFRDKPQNTLHSKMGQGNKKESNFRQNRETSSKRKGGAKHKNTRKSYRDKL